MNVDQFNTLGGYFEVVGVGFVARDLISLARFRGKLTDLAAWFRARWAAIATRVRRLLRRPGPSVVAHAGAATASVSAFDATARGIRGPFVPQPGQSLQHQIAELASLVNRLREEVLREPQERERAITAEREARREELRAEAERLEGLLDAARQELEELREATTGDLGLRVESVAFLLGGIVLTTCPQWCADRLPGWPPFRVAMFFLGAYLLGRTSWALWLRPHTEPASAET
jgi:hypothetical protein